ncbi:MAG: hypothetical protein GOVbin4685_13 [Prokaryotic dsDNA virus sp.]|jgi:hypothetical protein|nr:MAG: hypothetical protein GOVbin4685_13 [Prokaryotic dsDNA virus sp.]|tara:strand:- start:8126 stop:8962 length:837 start_codon:yes stop_codon:yes gene_type:complete
MIVFDPTKAADLAAAGESNNPIVFWDSVAASSGTLSTSIGTEVESAALSATGTTYDAWIATPSGANEAALQLVLPSAQSLNCIAIAAHNIGTIGAQVRVQYSTDSGGSWVDAGAGVVAPTDDRAILFYFDDFSSDYWRVFVNFASSDVEVAVAFWGNALTIPQRLYQGYRPPITPTNVMLQSNVSQGGNLLGAAVTRQGSSFEASITYVDPTFIRGADFKGFMRHHNDGKGFFWAWRPTKYTEDIFYGWREGNTISPSNDGPKDLMAFGMGLRLYDDT